MKFNIVKPSSAAKTPPVADKANSKPKQKPAKEVVKKRRSDKEIALIWLDERLNEIATKAAEMTPENMEAYADGRKVADQHARKMQSIVEGRVEKYRKPIVVLLEARGLA